MHCSFLVLSLLNFSVQNEILPHVYMIPYQQISLRMRNLIQNEKRNELNPE